MFYIYIFALLFLHSMPTLSSSSPLLLLRFFISYTISTYIYYYIK